MATPDRPVSSAAWRVTCGGFPVNGPFDNEQDARDMADSWNSAYPPPKYPEFVVERVSDAK